MHLEMTWTDRLGGSWQVDGRCPICLELWTLFPEGIEDQEQAAGHARFMFRQLGACADCREICRDNHHPGPPMNRAARRAARRRR